MKLHPAYRMIEEPPTVEEYRAMRAAVGLKPVRADQAQPALENSWAWVTIRPWASDDLAAMGRIISDGGWYFLLTDLTTAPSHQQRGLGRSVLEALLERIEADAPDNPYVVLQADNSSRKLYTEMGFVPTAPTLIGMRRSDRATQ